MIEAARAEIERAIAQAKSREGELSGVADALSDQLASLDKQLASIRSASASQLLAMQVSLPRTLNQIQLSASVASQQASAEVTMHVAEMSSEAIYQLQRSHDERSVAFQHYELRSHSRIEQLASASGLDITGYQENRDRLLAQREDAHKRGDRVGVFRSDALLAGNNLWGLVKTGASNDEIEEAKRQAREARERFLKEKEIEALQAGRAIGLSGEVLKNHVDLARSKAASELDQENRKNAQRAGLSPEQMVQASLAVNAKSAANEAKINSILSQEAISPEPEVRHDGGYTQKDEAQARQIAQTVIGSNILSQARAVATPDAKMSQMDGEVSTPAHVSKQPVSKPQIEL